MIVGSIKEELELEKRVSLTPETAKNIIGLGLKVCIEKNYAEHLGINDNEYKDIGVEVKATSNEVTNSSNLIIKVNCPSENQINSSTCCFLFFLIEKPSKMTTRVGNRQNFLTPAFYSFIRRRVILEVSSELPLAS